MLLPLLLLPVLLHLLLLLPPLSPLVLALVLLLLLLLLLPLLQCAVGQRLQRRSCTKPWPGLQPERKQSCTGTSARTCLDVNTVGQAGECSRYQATDLLRSCLVKALAPGPCAAASCPLRQPQPGATKQM